MTSKKDHRVQVLMGGFRYVAAEMAGTISFSRDGVPVGKAQWQDDQLVHSSATLPDDVVFALEKLLKEQFDTNWGE